MTSFTILNIQWLLNNRSDRPSLTCGAAIYANHSGKKLEFLNLLYIRICDHLICDFAIFVVQDPRQSDFVACGFDRDFAKSTKTCHHLVVVRICSCPTCLKPSLQWQPSNNCNQKILPFLDCGRFYDR